MRDWVQGKIKIDTLLAFLFGISFLIIALIVSWLFPQMGETMILQVIVALSAAAITAGIPGLFTLNFLSPGKVLTIKMTGALLIFMIVCAVDAEPRQSIAFIQMSLILLTPLWIRQGVKRQKVKITKATLSLLSAAFMLCEAAFFSQLAGGRLPQFPYKPQGTQVENNVLSGQDLIGTNQQKVWVPDTKLVKVIEIEGGIDHKPDELHLLLDVEWAKWEKFPTFPRNYRGQIYYRMRYQCQGGKFTQRDVEFDYSLKPGKIVLSWLIGFIEIPFLLDENTVEKIIQRVFTGAMLYCLP